MYVLDTNILIAYVQGDEKASMFILEGLQELSRMFVSAISVIEFLSLPGIPQKDREFFSLLLRELIIVPVDYELAVMAGQIRSQYGIKLGDSVIAATAILEDALLVSRDKGFKKIKEIQVISL